MSSFRIVYGRDPITPLDLSPILRDKVVSSNGIDCSQYIKELHQRVRDNIIKHNERYQVQVNKHRKQVVYKEGDLVWIHFRPKRFPRGRFNKLQPRADGPFRALQRINDNAYKIKLPGHYNVSATFNVADLSPYESTIDEEVDSESSHFQAREEDADAEATNVAYFG